MPVRALGPARGQHWGQHRPAILPTQAARLRGEGHHGRRLHVRRLHEPVAFVGVDGSVFRHNTIYRPRRYAFRILQETTQPGFVPSRNGKFTDNVIAFRSDELAEPINVGPATAPDTFTLAHNAWYCLDVPSKSRPNLRVPEAEGTYGTDPGFVDAEAGDFRLRPDSLVRAMGARSASDDKGKKD